MNQYIKLIKIAAGSTLAISIAYAAGLDYAVSAGIITLLTLQDTKKETLAVALKRIAAFVIALIIAYAIFHILAYTPYSYGVFLLVFTWVCLYFRMQDAIPINAVLATHYLLERSVSGTVVLNEVLLLAIGAGIGIILNLYIPSNVKQIRKKQSEIEECLKLVLIQMAEGIVAEDRSILDGKCMTDLKEYIERGTEQAYQNMNNSFFQESRYFIEYMEMRNQQYHMLLEIYDRIRTMPPPVSQAYLVGEFVKEIASSLSETQNTKGLLASLEQLLIRFQGAALPVTREEFETRAILYVLLMNFRLFLLLKKNFVDALSPKQKERYWGI